MTSRRAQVEIAAKDNASRVLANITQEQKRLAEQTKRATAANDSFNRSNRAMRTGMRSSRGTMGQMSYQIQDIAVQLQGGQNAMLVFSQQGSQMASVFGPTGIVVGALLAVGGALASALIPNLFDTKDLLGQVEEYAEDVSASFDDFEDKTNVLSDSMERLFNISRQAFMVEVAQDVYQAEKAMKNLNTEVQNMVTEAGDDRFKLFAGALDQIENMDEAVARMKDEFVGMTDEQAVNQLTRNYKNSASALAKELDISTQSAFALGRAFLDLENGKITPASFQNTIDGMGLQSEKATMLASDLRKLTDQWGEFASAAKVGQDILDGGEPTFPEPDKKGGKEDIPTIAGLTPFKAQPWQIGVPDEKLVEEWFTRVAAQRNETLRREYLASKDEPWMIGLVDPETLQTALDDMDSRLQSQHDKQMERLRDQVTASLQATGAVAGYFEQLASNKQSALAEEVANSKNMSESEIKNREKAAERAFEAEKKWALAGVAMNTGVAAMKALATEDPFTKWASFAAVLATGATQAAAIEGRTFNSGAFNPSAATTSQPISNTTNNQSITNNVTVQGGVGFGIAELQELFDNDNVIIDPNSAQGRALTNG